MCTTHPDRAHFGYYCRMDRIEGPNRQPEKRREYHTLVLNDRLFGDALAVSFFKRRARLSSHAFDLHCSIEKRRTRISSHMFKIFYQQNLSKFGILLRPNVSNHDAEKTENVG